MKRTLDEEDFGDGRLEKPTLKFKHGVDIIYTPSTYKDVIRMVRLLMFLLLCVGLTAGAQAATLIYDAGFDGSYPPQTSFDYDTDMSGNKVPWAFNFSSTHKRSGTHSVRIENRPEGTSANMIDANTGKRRREIEPRQSLQGENRVYLPEGGDAWHGFSVMLDPNWVSMMKNPGKEIIIVQHYVRQSETSWHPEYLWIIREDGRVRVQVYWGATKDTRSSRFDTTFTLKPGQWYDVVIHRHRKLDSTGRHRLWIDGKLVADVTGPNMLKEWNLPGAIVKWGPYTAYGDSTYVLYYDNVKVARGADGYDTVNPAAGASSQPTPPQNLTVTRH